LLNNTYMFGAHFIYVTIWKNPSTCTCFCFVSTVYMDPCHRPTWYLISQCRNGIIQVLWLGIIIMVQLRHHRETACHSQPSVMTTWQTGVGGGPHLTVAHSACVRWLFTQKHIILIHVRHHVSIYVCFFVRTVPPTAVGNYRRGCLLKQDMSAGDNANCCSGRLSIGNLQGHTPWVFFGVPSRASSRLTA